MTCRHVAATITILGLSLGLAGPARPQADAVASATIHVFQFQPATVEVRTGTRVTWTNQDAITHTVTSGVPERPDGRFDVRLEGNGTSGGALFATPGAYPYFCARHPSMRGEVVVR